MLGIALTTAVTGAPSGSKRDGLSFWRTRRCAVLIGAVLAVALSWAMMTAVWTKGTFFDTDDAMRMVQIRDWLSGQGWYDLTAYRIDPPFGVLMHWSRVVDVPIAILLKAFGAFLAPATAERLARIVYSLAWLAALIFATCWTSEALEGRESWTPAAVLTALSGLSLTVFQPGRIDHDSIQITLLVLALGATFRALEPEKWRWAALGAAFAAVALAVGLEELPLFVVLFSALPLAWVVRGDELRRAVAALGAGLAVCLPLVFAATLSPARWTVVACDALSPFHLVALGLGALFCLALAAASPRLQTRTARCACALASGALTIGISAILFPVCFRSPYAQVDPLVRRLWLDTVSEARPLLSVIMDRPSMAPMLVAPFLFGFAATVDGALRSRGIMRERWILTTALACVGGALAFWEIRALVAVAPIILFGAIRVAMAVARARPGASSLLKVELVLLAMLPFSPLPYAAIPAFAEDPAKTKLMNAAYACLAPGSFPAIEALPPGRVLAPITAGSHLLVYTQDTVFGAPYHRNNRGNRFVLDAFRSPAAAARVAIAAEGVRYVMMCHGLDGPIVKGSLADLLEEGRPPSWLVPVKVVGTPFKVYEVRQESAAQTGFATP